MPELRLGMILMILIWPYYDPSMTLDDLKDSKMNLNDLKWP